jgi:hypothetical protein
LAQNGPFFTIFQKNPVLAQGYGHFLKNREKPKKIKKNKKNKKKYKKIKKNIKK